MPRKGSSVTFDIGEPTVRRHSSPAPSLRFRKDSVIEAGVDCGRDSCPVCAAGIGKKAASVTVSTGRGNGGGNGNGNGGGTPGVHQPLEKRSSSRVSRCSNGGGGGSSNVESLVSVVMTTTTVPEDAGVAESTSKTHSGRSSLASLRPTTTATSGDPLSKTATTAVEFLYGPSTVGPGGPAPGGRSSPRRSNTNGTGSSHMIIDFVTSSTLNDRPSSAPVTRPPGRAEAGTQTPRKACTGGFMMPGSFWCKQSLNVLSLYLHYVSVCLELLRTLAP